MLYGSDFVRDILPHREPFLFIDSIDEVDISNCGEINLNSDSLSTKDFVGGVVKASFFVRQDLEIFKGHFPGNPILPGVIQTEMMAQAAPFIFLKMYENKDYWPELKVALLGIDRSRFRKPVVPEMQLTIVSELIKVRGDFQNYDAKLFSGDELIASAEVFASLILSKPGGAK